MKRRLILQALLGMTIVAGLVVEALAAAPPESKEQAAAAKAAPAAKPDAAPAAKPDAAPAKPEPPPLHTVKPSVMKVTVDLDGVFEAQAVGEVVVRLEEWASPTGLTVASAVKHGASVRKGDVLVTFDTEKLDRAIADLAADVKLAELGLKQSEEQLSALQKTTPMDLEANERLARATNEDRKQYFDVEQPYQLKATEFNLRSAKFSLEYMEEELRQLQGKDGKTAKRPVTVGQKTDKQAEVLSGLAVGEQVLLEAPKEK